MSREAAGLIMVGVALLLLLLVLLAWRRRVRRDAGLRAPLGIPEDAEIRERRPILYVATTRHDEPLERLAITPLAYRARGEAVRTDRGLALSIDGAPVVFLPSEQLISVDRSQWTIDRVVEPGGLVRVTWRVDEENIVDTYFRLTAGEISDLIRDLAPLCKAPQTGASA